MEGLDQPLRILLVGNGGREHALAWRLSQSRHVAVIYACPGNGGTASGGSKIVNVSDPSTGDFPRLMTFAKEQGVNLVVPGAEAPLVAGIEGACRKAGIRCFGPTVKAAEMEGSKTFAKRFMERHDIPTAKFGSFKDYDDAVLFLKSNTLERVVIKADGLAAGKGVVIPSNMDEAVSTLKEIMVDKTFGAAGDEVIIEEFLEGEELSVLSFCDGYTIRSLPPAQDHKQIRDGDQGPMTGGMGCYSPTKIATPELIEEIHQKILRPTIDGMRKEGFPFVGILFTGLMITPSGPRVLEYNVRGGDPETETLLPLLSPETDLAEVMLACTDRYLDAMTITCTPNYSATVFAVAGGYPGPYARGEPITITSPTPSDTMLFHAGTTLSPPTPSSPQPTLLTSGGRVIAANATAPTLQHALEKAYAAIKTISYNGISYRRDIGHRDLNRTSASLATPPSSTSPSSTPLTYAQTGVSLTSATTLLSLLKPLTTSTSRPGADASIGGFGGLFSLPLAGYPRDSPTLIGAIDGVGTKLLLAHALGIHTSVGVDLVAMNVNDLIVQGAEPLFFLDCFSTGRLDVGVARDFVEGVAAGCREAGCALVGGETAEMPGLFARGTGGLSGEGEGEEDGECYDAVGAAVGAVRAGRKILPDKEFMGGGDVLLGLGSAGCHSNGFSLVRRVVERAGLKLTDAAPWVDGGEGGKKVGEELLTPTRIYVKALLAAFAEFNTSTSGEGEKSVIKGLAHITGGGLVENVPRALPKHLRARIDARKWTLPPVFRWLKKEGGVEDGEMARVWNCGVGMVLIVDAARAEEVRAFLEEKGERCFVIGRVEEMGSEAEQGEGEGNRCVVDGCEEAWKV